MATAGDVDALHRAGHEIGCHTHDGVPVDELRPAELARQVELSAEAFRGGAADRRFSSFSYPAGAVTVAAKRQLARRFASLRGATPGLNTGVADLALLRSVEIGDPTVGRTPEQWLDLAHAEGGWLVFHCRDVDGGSPGGGATSEQLDRTVTRACDLGFEVLPVRHAIGRLQGT
jgi:peptidoglycan/xylan/chitin deacetylase (PgdA/CDA1 family)